ncbi:hypothetical protein [Nocardia crassostreae]|nr:hypothetical protein [Nocardia crassostreae]
MAMPFPVISLEGALLAADTRFADTTGRRTGTPRGQRHTVRGKVAP